MTTSRRLAETPAASLVGELSSCRDAFSVLRCPGYGLMLPLVPLAWAARAAGREVLMASTSDIVDLGARAGLAVYDVVPDRDVCGTRS